MQKERDTCGCALQTCTVDHKTTSQLSGGVLSLIVRCILNFFLKSGNRRMAGTQVPAAADPKLKEIMTSLDDDKIGAFLQGFTFRTQRTLPFFRKTCLPNAC